VWGSVSRLRLEIVAAAVVAGAEEVGLASAMGRVELEL
jgi:hypothetical protein